MSPRQGIDLNVIVHAAVEILDTEGINNVTLAALASKLHVKTPSLYNHIAGLPGLRKQLAIYGLSLLRERLIQAVLGKSGDEAVIALGFAYVSIVREHPGLYETTMVTAERMDQDILDASEGVLKLILQILEAYHLSEDEALHTVRGLRSLMHGFASVEARGGFGMDLNHDESLRHLLQTYLLGIKHRSLK
jgi:AcrR family transcriptional regulator